MGLLLRGWIRWVANDSDKISQNVSTLLVTLMLSAAKFEATLPIEMQIARMHAVKVTAGGRGRRRGGGTMSCFVSPHTWGSS